MKHHHSFLIAVLLGALSTRAAAQVPGTAACFGDGSGGLCPCGNTGAAGAGCANGIGTGAVLGASGSNGIVDDDLVLQVSGAVRSQPGLFFQGNALVAGGNGAAFGDGIRCCGQSIVRLQVVAPGAGGTASTSISIPSHAPGGTVHPGDQKCYQFWYRNPGSSPCGSNFNLSNAYVVGWTAGGTPSVSGISDTTPAPGQVVTIDGAGFLTDPAYFCGPPALATSATSTQITAMIAHGPAGTFDFGIANGDLAQGWGSGPGQMMPPPIPGVDLSQGFGATLEVDPAELVGTGITITTGAPLAASTLLPVSIVNGQICIDFTAYGPWVGGEILEVEFHFDAAGTHCDFFHTKVAITNSGSSNQVAFRAGDAIVGMISGLNGACKDIQASANGGILCLYFTNATIINLHPYSHVTVFH